MPKHTLELTFGTLCKTFKKTGYKTLKLGDLNGSALGLIEILHAAGFWTLDNEVHEQIKKIYLTEVEILTPKILNSLKNYSIKYILKQLNYLFNLVETCFVTAVEMTHLPYSF